MVSLRTNNGTGRSTLDAPAIEDAESRLWPADNTGLYRSSEVRILVLDDDEAVCRVIQAALAPNDFRVEVVSDPLAMEEAVKRQLYDKLRSLSRHGTALCGVDHGVVMLAEAGHSDADTVGVLAGPLDVVGRITGRAVLTDFIEEGKQPVEADGRTIKGGKIESSHHISSVKRHAEGPPEGRTGKRAAGIGQRTTPFGKAVLAFQGG